MIWHVLFTVFTDNILFLLLIIIIILIARPRETTSLLFLLRFHLRSLPFLQIKAEAAGAAKHEPTLVVSDAQRQALV